MEKDNGKHHSNKNNQITNSWILWICDHYTLLH
jgi:hypothetical protein